MTAADLALAAARQQAIRDKCRAIDAALSAKIKNRDDDLFLAGLGMWLGRVLRKRGVVCAEDWLFWLGEDVL